MTFKRIAVIGAGTMGSGIAGQIANAGHKVLLLDLTTKATDYALERLQKSEPAPLHQHSNIELIETGTIEADFTSWRTAIGSSKPLWSALISSAISTSVWTQ